MVGWVLVEAEEVDVGEVSCDGWWNIVLVNLVEDEVEFEFQLWCCLWTRMMNKSMESEEMLAPLFFFDERIVSQMFPGSE